MKMGITHLHSSGPYTPSPSWLLPSRPRPRPHFHAPTHSTDRAHNGKAYAHTRSGIQCRSSPSSLPDLSHLPRPASPATAAAATAAAVALLCTTSLLTLSPACASSSQLKGLATDIPLFDGAGIVARDTQAELTDSLIALESTTGWRVRALTYSDPSAAPTITELREAWRPDKRTVIVQYDPSSPNVIAFPYIGDEVLQKLRRPFWSELQTRFGNMFYIRQEGEQAAVRGSLTALVGCLESPRGCAVVPGLPEDQYFFTLGTSIAGGLVAGFVSRLEPQGFVKRRWVWLLLFSPLWGSLFINFGLGPIISRTADLQPVLANSTAFLVAAAAPALLTLLLGRQPQPKP